MGSFKDERQWFVKHIVVMMLTSAGTAAGTLFLGWLVFAQALFEENRELQAEVNRLNVQIARLELRLDERYNESPEAAIEKFLDDLPMPAWCKLKIEETGEFRMFHVNPQYEIRFGVTNERYSGRTDHEIWPKALADRYLENDRQTFRLRASVRVWEPVSEDNLNALGLFWKWYHETETNSRMVCGALVDEP